MEEELLNGFSASEVFRLYKFLCIYESKIKGFTTNKDLFAAYPRTKEPIENFIKRFRYYTATKDAMQAMGVLTLLGEFYCIRRKSQPLDLLYHIRNSIAHCQIEQEENVIRLIDYDINKTTGDKTFSGRGTFDRSLFFEIIDFVNANIAL